MLVFTHCVCFMLGFGCCFFLFYSISIVIKRKSTMLEGESRKKDFYDESVENKIFKYLEEESDNE